MGKQRPIFQAFLFMCLKSTILCRLRWKHGFWWQSTLVYAFRNVLTPSFIIPRSGKNVIVSLSSSARGNLINWPGIYWMMRATCGICSWCKDTCLYTMTIFNSCVVISFFLKIVITFLIVLKKRAKREHRPVSFSMDEGVSCIWLYPINYLSVNDDLFQQLLDCHSMFQISICQT